MQPSFDRRIAVGFKRLSQPNAQQASGVSLCCQNSDGFLPQKGSAVMQSSATVTTNAGQMKSSTANFDATDALYFRKAAQCHFSFEVTAAIRDSNLTPTASHYC